jgi:S-adenosylmethionine:diacylglycerol 3-amino-3-carboxypropyl transferase
MREAYRLDIANTKYRDDYFMTRVVAGKLDQNSEELLQEYCAFHDEYEFRRDKARRVEELWGRHLGILREAQLQNLPREWSYSEAPPQPIPIVGPGELPVEKRTFELESTELLISRETME